MKVLGLDGKSYNWNLSQHRSNNRQTISSLHKRCREIIQGIYPTDILVEEIPLPGSYGLYGDFYLPLRRKLIEPGGRQHSQFVRHFHKNKMGYAKANTRDSNKVRWCELNNIQLIVLLEDDECEWGEQIAS